MDLGVYSLRDSQNGLRYYPGQEVVATVHWYIGAL